MAHRGGVSIVDKKENAARRALELVRTGMALGLGTGSTANCLVRALGGEVREGRLSDLRCVATSRATARLAEAEGLHVVTLEEQPMLDLTLDGADEVDPEWNLIKGGGGSLLREKIVAQASRQLAILIDDSKMVRHLGERWSLPIEVVPFGWKTHLSHLEDLGGKPRLRLRSDGEPFVTDEGNFTLDVDFSGAGAGRGLSVPETLHRDLLRRAGIVETGLFLGMASFLIVGTEDGATLDQR
ncbi:MAG: ribose 5-phosphate isomerase A [Candidatus Eisenbacteria bacterium]|uniref:Ribose-5-phosphate isomerase A n=1 Tax=Eiseniibacteriota bacterium TaxID=2212470 RepID=A0A956RQD9_UNCEI|nr:ribose 5-phosphate isomerase A [Candidatus Eisenbacteria bacterium]